MIFPFLSKILTAFLKVNCPLSVMKATRKLIRKLKRRQKKKKKKRKVNYDNIAEVKTRRCCSGRCIQLILTVSDIYKTRECLFEKSRESQGQLLLNFFQVARRSKGQNTVYVHTIEKKYVCQKAWIFSHGIAYGR